MSGDAEIPPTYYFSGITFNPSFYQSSSSDYLTLATAKSNFLTYPTAQGTETITTLISSSIDSVSTSNDLNLAFSQVGGVLTLANGARTGNINIGANATQGNINFGSNTNDETRISGAVVNVGYNQSTGNIIIGGNQTTGTINIGVKAGRLAAGAINICSTNQTNSLVIPITIGNASSTTAMNGTCTFSKQISASAGLTSAGNITTSGTATITALSTGSLIGPYQNAATPTAAITTAGAITGTSLVLGTGNIASCGSITASGTITADGGISLPVGDAINVLGSITGSGAISTSGNISTSGSGTITSAGLLTASSSFTVSTGTITIPTSASAGATSILTGRVGYFSTTTPYTIVGTLINSTYLLYVTSGSGTITLPAATAGQTIIIRSISANAITIASGAGDSIIQYASLSLVTSFSVGATNGARLYAIDASTWIGIS